MDDLRAPTGAAKKPWQALSLPSHLLAMRSMLSHEEKQYLTWLTGAKSEGRGAIIDLGAWLGSSTAALAEGLDRAGRPDRIHSFDMWEWDPAYMEGFAHENLAPGADFQALFMRELGPYAVRVEPHKEDLTRYTWNGGSIDILFVDAAKTWELTNAIFKGFGDHLVPGQSRVVLQDFRYYETHWLPLMFDSRPDLWCEVESVDDGATVTFVPLKHLHGVGGIDAHYSEESFSLADAERILRNRIEREPGPNRHYLLRTLYRIVLANGSADAASGLRAEVVASGVRPDELVNIEDVSSLLVARGWRAYTDHDFRSSRSIAERCLTGRDTPPIFAQALLGMSLLKLGDVPGARRCVDDVVTRAPDYLDARLHRAEVALAEGRRGEAAVDAEYVLGHDAISEQTIRYARGILDVASRPAASATTIEQQLTGPSVDAVALRDGHASLVPPRGDLSGLRRLSPISREWGFDRGLPIDRHYIERFLKASAADIHGRVLEIEDDMYTRRYGGDAVSVGDILHVVEGNPRATIVGDLTSADHIPSNAFDCAVITQTLHLIYDVRAAIRTLHRILKPGGVLLATFPGLSRTSHSEWEGSWYWGFTSASASRMFGETFGESATTVVSHGNILTSLGFLHGLAAEDLTAEELDFRDPDYDLLITARAVKATAP